MTVAEALEALRYRLVVRDRTSGFVGNLTALEWCPEGETLVAGIAGRSSHLDVLDLELVHPDDTR